MGMGGGLGGGMFFMPGMGPFGMGLGACGGDRSPSPLAPPHVVDMTAFSVTLRWSPPDYDVDIEDLEGDLEEEEMFAQRHKDVDDDQPEDKKLESYSIVARKMNREGEYGAGR